MNKSLQWTVACVGAGYFSRFHIDAWLRLTDINLLGIADPAADKIRADKIPVYDSLTEMVNEVEPDVLDIITPPHTHLAVIQEAINLPAIKLIICQKPFCNSLDEAIAITQAAKFAGKILIVHENFRFQPWFRTIKQQLDSGAIGTLLQMTVRLRPGDGQGNNAYIERQPYFQTMPRLLIHETGVHYIDTFRYLLGEPTALYADLRKMNPVIAGEDAGYVVFDYPNGVRALLDGNRLLDHAAENLRCTMCEVLVEGTQGTLQVRGDGSVWHRAFHTNSEDRVFTLPTTDQFGGDCAYHLQAHVVDYLNYGNPLENLAEDYLNVMRQEALVYRSSEEGRKLAI